MRRMYVALTPNVRSALLKSVALVAAIATTSAGHAQVAPADAAASQTTEISQTTAVTPAEDGAMVESPMFKIGWPKIKMPEFQWKKFWGSDSESTPATTPIAETQNPVSEALDKVSSASKRAADGVRNAWGSTLARITPSNDETATMTAKRDEPGFWSRLFGAEEPQRDAQTVSEFLAQERVGTTTR